MDLVIVGSMGYDDIETPVATGSDILGGSAVHAGVSASFHLPKTCLLYTSDAADE